MRYCLHGHASGHAEVRLVRPDQLEGSLTGGLVLQRLAESTHLPTGIASSHIRTIDVPAGGSTEPRTAADDGSLLHVLAGEVRVKWGPSLAGETPAGPGDTVLVPAGTLFRADNASPSAGLRFIVVSGG